ncbi:MAG: Ppx/GppA phosphatase family protein [Solirubrobacterales bacterium]
MRIAAIDIGTNSTRLLVADIAGGRIDELFRRSAVTRLGDRVDLTGRLDAGACDRVYAVLAEYRDEIARAGASRVGGVATSAVRDAENGAEFIAEIAGRFGIEVTAIGGDTEAQLTFAGANSAGAVGDGDSIVVIDIGGGSTEFIVGHGGELDFHVSTHVGAVRQSERFLHSDPPAPDELKALLAEVTEIIRDAVPERWRAGVTHGIAVAGTATVLASVDQALEPFDPWKVHGYRITVEACGRLLDSLAALPLARRRDVTGLHPDRAPTIVAGAAIMLVAMRQFDLPAIEVSEHDILYGLALRLSRD